MKIFIYTLVLTFLCAVSVRAATVEQQLKVIIGPFDAARVRMTYTLDRQNYAFVSAIRTAGLFAKIHQFSAEYVSSGAIENNHLIAGEYSYVSQTSSHHRTKKLFFDKNGRPVYRLSSKNNKSKRVDINLPETPFDAADMQTVFSALARQFRQNKFCAMEKKVFDGKKNYVVIIEDEGKTHLNDPDIAFNGEAWKCSMFIKQTGADDDDLLLNMTAERPVYFWIMPDTKTKLPFLAKIEIDSTPLGRLKAYTTKVNVKD